MNIAIAFPQMVKGYKINHPIYGILTFNRCSREGLAYFVDEKNNQITIMDTGTKFRKYEKPATHRK